MADDLTLEDEFLDAANELREITAARRDLDAREKRAKELLAKVLVAGQVGVDADNTPLVKVKAGARVFHEDTARMVLADRGLGELIAGMEVTETHLSKDKAKALLPGDIYTACCKQNNDSIVVA